MSPRAAPAPVGGRSPVLVLRCEACPKGETLYHLCAPRRMYAGQVGRAALEQLGLPISRFGEGFDMEQTADPVRCDHDPAAREHWILRLVHHGSAT